MKGLLSVYSGRRVFVTGHTGFKGSWLSEILLLAGAEVHGYSLEPPTKPSLFETLGLAGRIASHATGDVRDAESLARAFAAAKPDFVFHLAAQPLVLASYARPAETFDVNVMGTVNLLSAAAEMPIRRESLPKCAIVCVTTDKVYANDDSGRPFVETDRLGGKDPYSASKAACEIAVASFRRSFFSSPATSSCVSSARAGNVIGGGDWAEDRIVPDAMRAFLGGKPLDVRNPGATRPWQHVLEPLSGYLALAAAMRGDPSLADAYNFGPSALSVNTVRNLVESLANAFPGAKVRFRKEDGGCREAKMLALDSGKAARILGWKPRWDFADTVGRTADWYLAGSRGEDMRAFTDAQIAEFFGV